MTFSSIALDSRQIYRVLNTFLYLKPTRREALNRIFMLYRDLDRGFLPDTPKSFQVHRACHQTLGLCLSFVLDPLTIFCSVISDSRLCCPKNPPFHSIPHNFKQYKLTAAPLCDLRPEVGFFYFPITDPLGESDRGIATATWKHLGTTDMRNLKHLALGLTFCRRWGKSFSYSGLFSDFPFEALSQDSGTILIEHSLTSCHLGLHYRWGQSRNLVKYWHHLPHLERITLVIPTKASKSTAGNVLEESVQFDFAKMGWNLAASLHRLGDRHKSIKAFRKFMKEDFRRLQKRIQPGPFQSLTAR